MTEQTRLQQLRCEEQELIKKLGHVRTEIYREELSEIEKVHGVKIGSIVLSRGKEYKVTHIQQSYIQQSYKKPWLTGNLRKKDGTFGTAERYLYGERYLYSDWELIEK